MEKLTLYLEIAVMALTFVASLAGISMLILSVGSNGWGSPLPRRRFLPLLFALGLGYTRWLPHQAAILVGLLFALVFIASDQLLDWVLVRLGWVRATYYLAKVAGQVETPRELWLRPVLLAARALRKRPSTGAASFVARRLAQHAELGPLGAAAAAILAEVRGDVAGAQRILRGVTNVQDAVLDKQLWPVLRDARLDDTPATALDSEQVDAPPAAVEASLVVQAALARRLPGRARVEDVAAAIGSLQALGGSSNWHARLTARAVALGVAEAAVSAHRTLLSQVESDLAEAAIDQRWPSAWFGSGPAADAMRSRVREQRLATVEHLANELRRRARACEDLSEAEEWQAWGEFARVSQELERDAALPGDHQLHFRGVHRAIWDYGYRQAFVLGRRRLGGVVFLRQRRLAYAAEAADAYDTIEGNFRASRAPASPLVRDPDADWLCNPQLVQRWQRLNVAVVRFAYAVIALAVIFGAATIGPGVSMMALAVVLTVLQARSLKYPVVVEVLVHQERVAIQTPKLRYSFAFSEVQLQPSWGQLSRVRLARTPHGVPSTLWTVHASRRTAVRERADLAQRAQSPASS